VQPANHFRYHCLEAGEVDSIWSIDRTEKISALYYMQENQLTLKQECHNLQTWPLGEPETYAPLLQACHQRGGWFLGVYDNDRLVAVSVLESEFIRPLHDTLQLKFLQISNGYRGCGLGRKLFHLAAAEAARRGAKFMYISATPSENTIRFYQRNGCFLADPPDTALYALEPEDIHLLYEITAADREISIRF
jgi:GNAT superfamily N-acetyltransferase